MSFSFLLSVVLNQSTQSNKTATSCKTAVSTRNIQAICKKQKARCLGSVCSANFHNQLKRSSIDCWRSGKISAFKPQ